MTNTKILAQGELEALFPLLESQDESVRKGAIDQLKQLLVIMAEKNEKYEDLLNTTFLMHTVADLNRLISVITEVASRITDSQAASTFVLTEDLSSLKTIALTGDKKDQIKEIIIPKDKGIAGWVFKNNQSIIIPDAAQDPRFDSSSDKNTGFTTKSIIATPIIINNKIIGVVEALNSNSSYRDEDMDMLKLLALQAGASIMKFRK